MEVFRDLGASFLLFSESFLLVAALQVLVFFWFRLRSTTRGNDREAAPSRSSP